jgi:hypothetical protein
MSQCLGRLPRQVSFVILGEITSAGEVQIFPVPVPSPRVMMFVVPRDGCWDGV